ncbi:MAG: hypothetical protein BWY92_00817 [Firmicutes bacterium ADurb.BinA052]|nr:MAG: hypothetical protein BWY92_00817 [Firmicutes bacterium ADurb.BinA052]
MKLRIAAAPSPGVATGTTTRRKAVNRLHPSMSAASSKLPGTPSRKADSSQMEKGSVMVRQAIVSDTRLSYMASRRATRAIGMARTAGGNICIANMATRAL